MDMRKDGLLAFFIICIIATFGLGVEGDQFTSTVLDFGAIGDGETDDSQAFLKAWEYVCGATPANATTTLQIPSNKTYLLQPMTFAGPCNSSSVHIQVLGSIVAPKTLGAWKTCPLDSWLFFSKVENLKIDGTGKFDGYGSAWWNQSQGNNSCSRPSAIHFDGCNNLEVSGLTHLNSPKNHISLSTCVGVSIANLHIIAPEDSPNTDGIDIKKSSQVTIYNSFIGTGDDCIAINGGSSIINITKVTCGPGHGISVGSLGQNGANETVEDVYVHNCVFNRSQNGARIKTWPGGSGYARNISFVQILLVETGNPIVIDQFYSNGNGYGAEHEKAVAVSDVTFSNFQGTCLNELATTLNCSSSIGCTNIIMNEIDITSSEPGTEVDAYCKNAEGKITSSSLHVSCLINEESPTPSPKPSCPAPPPTPPCSCPAPSPKPLSPAPPPAQPSSPPAPPKLSNPAPPPTPSSNPSSAL